MQQIQVSQPGVIDLVDLAPQRSLQPDEVRIQIKATGICGSDIHVYEGMNPMAKYPVVLGHEAAGIVTEIGPGVVNCQVADHVVLEPLLACGQCYACTKGRPNACASMKARGCHIDGFFSEEVVLSSHSVFLIPDSIPWEDAAMIEPYTIAAQAAFRSRAETDDFVLILGAGTMGITMVDVFGLLGCSCVVVDIDPDRLAIARRHGAVDAVLSDKGNSWIKGFKEKYYGNPPNIVIEATGIPSFLTLALELVSSAGRIINLGFSPSLAPISPLELTKKEVDLLGSRHQTYQFPKVINWVRRKDLRPSSIVNKTVKPSDAIQIFQDISEAHRQGRNPGKILLKWD